jgi:glycosyltransferase involved in cell wall biosynthesis
VLWWGRYDHDYSRNAIVRRCFEDLGWELRQFRPAISSLGHVEALLRHTPTADLIWVPCFRQRDVLAAARFARATRAPLVVDPLISAYDKQVGERMKFGATSARARRLLAWERALLGAADRVVADTDGHAGYFSSVLGVDPDRVRVVPVGADETLFRPAPIGGEVGATEVVFYGSFLALQGPEIIVQAARQVSASNLSVTLVGDGPLHETCRSLAQGCPLVRFEPWVDYTLLPQRIHQAQILLGVFGATPKADRVIPNKVYQSLACARPVITRRASAYPEELLKRPRDGLRFVEAGDPRALADAIDEASRDPASLEPAAADARGIYERWFSGDRVRSALARLLDSLGLPASATRDR